MKIFAALYAVLMIVSICETMISGRVSGHRYCHRAATASSVAEFHEAPMRLPAALPRPTWGAGPPIA